MSNVSIGVKSMPKSGTDSSNSGNPTIIGELIGEAISGKESIAFETKVRGVGRVTEAAEFQNRNNSREVLSKTHESPPFSRAPLVVPRASPSNENKRILPGWTRRNRGITTASQRQGQPISGQKRSLEESAEISQIDGQKNNLLVEADSQPRQQQ